jgi:hypothetical protein
MSVAEKIAPSEIVKSIRAKATLFLESTPFPSNRDEEWRFTSLRKYISGALSFAPIENKTEPTLPPFYHQCEGTKIVLHNGIFDEKKSVVLDDSFTINKSEEALQKLESALVSPNYFTAYNTAHFQYGFPTFLLHLLTIDICLSARLVVSLGQVPQRLFQCICSIQIQ